MGVSKLVGYMMILVALIIDIDLVGTGLDILETVTGGSGGSGGH